jgi:Protein of unknown function (DUF3093)
VQQPLETPGSPAGAPAGRYTERLWPSPAIWVLTAGLGALFGLIPAPINPDAAAWTAAIGMVLLLAALAASTPVVSVDDEWLRAGRARIRRALVTDPVALDAEEMRAARGRSLDARAYLCIRGWLPSGVKITLCDPADPTPYWLISSRHPDELMSALRAA